MSFLKKVPKGRDWPFPIISAADFFIHEELAKTTWKLLFLSFALCVYELWLPSYPMGLLLVETSKLRCR